MIKINEQAFEVGDIVRFERATLPVNRTRDYQITAVTTHGIEVSAGAFSYGHTFATATRIGITHRTTQQ